ncbi:MAG: S-layer homology domain-containing protein [Clostridia bacterium]|nr:S-layer homology domain-containing protein [Clostridia bacterium]
MKNFISIFLTLIIVLGMPVTSFAASNPSLDEVVADTATYIYKTVSDPQVGSIGGEWAVLGLARSGVEIPDKYYQNYYENVEEYVMMREGNLHDKKYTEYSRLIVALTSIGKNPENVAGYNLLTPLGDYEKTIWQGMNGPIWALIALDSGDYNMPQNPDAKVQATRKMYIERILSCQLPDGGWSLFGGTAAAESGDNTSDPDVTGMALQALSKYQDNERVKKAIDTALNTMSQKQDERGGFSSWGTKNSESCVQMLVALCELGIPIDDERFVKNGYTILDNLMNYYNDGNGFKHIDSGSGSNLMATEQAFYGIVAVKRARDGKNSLYKMSDAISFSENTEVIVGLEDKNPDVKKMEIINPGKTFADVLGNKDKIAIEMLASRGIINGKTENSFEPNSTMTRAEFATIIARGLGLPTKNDAVFKDVTVNDWFYNYVNTAYSYGIIKGVSENEFNPNGTITREEAAVMVSRAASLCGSDTDMDTLAVRDVLAGFVDYVRASDWAQNSLAFCYNKGILSYDAIDIKPKEAVTRAEIASMLYNMLSLAKLL